MIIGIHRAEFGSLAGVAPGHVGTRAVMLEIFEAQAETDASVGAHDAAKLIQISRLAVSGQAHDLVFVAKLAKPEILRHGGVIHAQRVRKCDGARDIHAIALARSPHRAGEIAQPVGREQRGLFEGRNKKRARQMSLVVFDAMEFRANLFRSDVKRLRERFGNSHESSQHFCSLAGKARHLQGVQKFRSQARPGVARDRDVVDFAQA